MHTLLVLFSISLFSAIEQATGYHGCELAVIDQADFSSIVRFAENFKNEPLDILVANAGLATPEYETTKDGWETT